MTPTLSASLLSRRALGFGAGAAVAAFAWPAPGRAASGRVAAAAAPAPDPAWEVRGVRPGEHAMLRTRGSVAAEGASGRRWTFEDNTAVTWALTAAGEVVEHRRGRLQLSPADGAGRTMEIFTGPVAEVLRPGAAAGALALSARAHTLIVAATDVRPDDAWRIADDPATVLLPRGASELRVFRARAGEDDREVFWLLRSPWLSELGAAAPAATLVWRGAGRLSAWRRPAGGADV